MSSPLPTWLSDLNAPIMSDLRQRIGLSTYSLSSHPLLSERQSNNIYLIVMDRSEEAAARRLELAEHNEFPAEILRGQNELGGMLP